MKLGSFRFGFRGALSIEELLALLPLLAAASLTSSTGDALPWISRQFSLGWFGVAALAVAGFASGSAWIEGSREMRALAVAIGAFAAYTADVLGGFIPDPHVARLVGDAAWFGVPIGTATWARAAFMISRYTRHAGEGQPAARGRISRFFEAYERHRVVYRRAAAAFAWLPAIAFTVLGSFTGPLWKGAAGQVAAWQGHSYSPTWVYFYLSAPWSVSLLIGAWLVLNSSYRARPRAMRPRDVLQAWYFARASGVVIVLWAMAALTSFGLWSEPVLDLAFAVYAAGFVLLLADAKAGDRAPRIRPPLWQRFAVATMAASSAVVFVAVGGFTLFRAGLVTFMVAVGLALVLSRGTRFAGEIDRPEPPPLDPPLPDPPPPEIDTQAELRPSSRLELVELTPDEVAVLELLLIFGTVPEIPGAPLALQVLEATLVAVERLDASVIGPNPHPKKGPESPLLRLLYALDDPETGTRVQPVEGDLLIEFVERFPALTGESFVGRLRSFNVLVRRTAEELRRAGNDQSLRGQGGTDPTVLETLIAECGARWWPGSSTTREVVRRRRNLYLNGGLPWLEQLPEALPERLTREPRDAAEKHVWEKEREAARSRYKRRLDEAPAMVIDAWVNHLNQAISSDSSI